MMQQNVTVHWSSQAAEFPRGRYTRQHTWQSDKGWTTIASSSPDVVPAPYSNPDVIDPEEAFLASISSCHMLWFIDLARRAGFRPIDYEDRAVGQMTPNEDGEYWVSEVVLSPHITWADQVPSAADVDRLHSDAHEKCFIANSVKTQISIRLGSR